MKTVVLRLVVIALLVYAGVALWYDRFAERLQQGAVSPPHKDAVVAAPVAKDTAAPAAQNFQVILTRNLFQASSSAATEVPTDDLKNLTETKLQLVLLGTVTGSREDSRAIIRDERSKVENIYRIGAEINGAVIVQVSRGKVVLLVNDRKESLTIKDPGNKEGSTAMGSGAGHQAPDESASSESTDVASESRVPEAQPRRRISFRNTGPATPAEGGAGPETVPGNEGLVQPPAESPPQE